LVYVGSYTTDSGGKGEGISVFAQDPDSGALTPHGPVAAITAPTFLAWHPSGEHMYAVNETQPGNVTGLAVDSSGALTAGASQPTGGDGPCHLTVHPRGGYVLCANYGSGSISVHPILDGGEVGARSDLVQHAGSGPDPDRQEGPHAHNVQLDLAGRRVLVIDLGTDEVRSYDLDLESGELETGPVARPTPGTGPRHAAFHPDGWVFVADELASTVTSYRYETPTGALTLHGSVPATAGPVEDSIRNYPSEIALSTDGRFIYVANRGADCITVFSVDGGDLTVITDVPSGGTWPRHFAITGEFLYVANQNSDTVGIFRINAETGIPEPTGDILDVPSPACILPAR
jgi:6-phosphogluconolactonase (cycloisomerase 2 family)